MTDIEKIRLNISDKTVPYQFSDAELQSFLDDEGSVKLASAAALEAWAAAYSTSPDNERIGDYAYAQSVTDKMLKLATKLRKDDAEKPSITWAEPNLMGVNEEEDI
ncbi:MAG: hypothetical protein MUO61_03525 [Dehalococcoidia bacterium]|nr:hypothetical protein [Dehalococcoidia bacterium]